MEKNIPMTTTEGFPGREIAQVLGLVKGNTVQTRHIGSHIVAGLTTIVGGEVKGYVKAITSAREEATDRMLVDARSLGADAIVCMRYSTSQIMNGAAEILAYGTAVKLK
jgi:uncharacterized protein YbjQ (UPF0145 family)